jgi:hypothetical protein
VSTSCEIFSSSTKNEYLKLELISKEVRSRLARFILLGNTTAISKGDNENSLKVLAIRCNKIVDKLLSILNTLKLHNN